MLLFDVSTRTRRKFSTQSASREKQRPHLPAHAAASLVKVKNLIRRKTRGNSDIKVAIFKQLASELMLNCRFTIQNCINLRGIFKGFYLFLNGVPSGGRLLLEPRLLFARIEAFVTN